MNNSTIKDEKTHKKIPKLPNTEEKSRGKIKSKIYARNEKIQGTNDSSIVSKRSVERLYWSKRTPGINGHMVEDLTKTVEFFRPFVSKPQRRSPTINRGYWTRMEAIINHIEYSIDSNTRDNVVIVGLGAGFDPYPFQYLYNNDRGKKYGSKIKFLDVDFPDLIQRKKEMILKSPEIINIIGEPLVDTDDVKHNVQLRTDFYLAVGCDLTKLDVLSKTFEFLFDFKKTTFVFTAEVSITYMPQKDAEKIVEWTSGFPHSRFVLLEQILPAGINHPFAKTMLKHFNNLNTPLNSVTTYQTTEKQIERYKSRGWKSVQASDLYSFYEHSISQEQKMFLDTVESFDEWEEFILFCQHYVILYASNDVNDISPLIKITPSHPQKNKQPKNDFIEIDTKGTSQQYHRKFAASCLFPDDGRNVTIFNNGGLSTTRSNESILISADNSSKLEIFNETFKERMCHTATLLEITREIVLIGGRTAPNKPLSDCWKLTKGKWNRISDLPNPRFRHHSISTIASNVIVFGGRGDREFSEMNWIQYDNKENNWVELKKTGDIIPNIFSSAVAWEKESGTGYIFGGLLNNYSMNKDVFKFILSETNVHIQNISSLFDPSDLILLARLGGKATFFENFIYVVGGVTNSSCIDLDNTIVQVDVNVNRVTPIPYRKNDMESNTKLPIYIGFNMDIIDERIVISGGGAVCFSFGSYWNQTSTIKLPRTNSSLECLYLIHQSSKLISNDEKKLITSIKQPNGDLLEQTNSTNVKPTPVKEIPIETAGASFNEFLINVYPEQKPIAFRNLDIGCCLKKWDNPNYLIDAVGKNQKVTVHVSEEKNMNFVAKNFDYRIMTFENLISKIFNSFPNSPNDKNTSNTKFYLRSLSSANPKNKPAIFSTDFPGISNDFILPKPFSELQHLQFSSPLRISSPETAIWLHYDVTANILFQVVGHKTVRLYPPSDARFLSFPTGSSTSLIENIFDYPSKNLGPVRPYEVDLGPGDAIFIPSCWLHATRSKEPSISINYFWKDLNSKSYSPGKDVYGNRDLVPYENGRTAVNKMAHGFEGVPSEVAKFYLQRLANEILEISNNM